MVVQDKLSSMPRNRGLHDRESKRDDIVAAARAMFVSDGFDRASISRLAKAAGITPNTVYWYFDDKDEILVAVLEAIAADDAADYLNVADHSLADRLVWLVERLQKAGPLVSTVHDRVAKSTAIENWHNGFHFFAESLFAADIQKSGLSGAEADAMLRIGTFVVEGLLTHAPSPEVVRSVIDRLVAAIPPMPSVDTAE